ncbi:LPO_1073/Vpar_1526 family protein [Streptomyces sp. NPDC093676]|uniref:LPO_1073/Vpar_1526 family protein n=1 Tax=Streptomyces sp. NPDC093676 TaxID=3366050 RepID=UPI003830E078
MAWWQKQRSGDNSQNIQAAVANFGLGYDDVLAVVSNYVDSSLSKLSQAAFEEAKDRVEELTVNYLHAIKEKQPEALENARDPGVQSAILDAQSAYAKVGDIDLGQVLVEMLVKRTENIGRDVQQLALTEAIGVTAKLSYKHVQLVTALFLTLAVTFGTPTSPDDLYGRLTSKLSPFLDGLTASDADIQYLADAGAVRIELLSTREIPSTFRMGYPGLYCNGVSEETFPDIKKYEGTPTLIPCIRDNSRLQVNAVNDRHLESMLAQLGMQDSMEELKTLLYANQMSDDAIEQELIGRVPGMKDFAQLWKGTVLKNCVPSIVGMAISHANLKKTLGAEFDADLGIWIS